MAKISNGTTRITLAKILEQRTNNCIMWPHAKAASGYGVMYAEGKVQTVSRVICLALYGEPPTEKHQAAHNCGKGHLGCCNPRHLRWATPLENSNDRKIHGTTGLGIAKLSSRGENNVRAKLSLKKVRRIRQLGQSKSASEIARQFGLHHSTVGRIIKGQAWAWDLGRSAHTA